MKIYFASKRLVHKHASTKEAAATYEGLREDYNENKETEKFKQFFAINPSSKIPSGKKESFRPHSRDSLMSTIQVNRKLDGFIDKLSDGFDDHKDLMKRDYIASYQESGGEQSVREKIAEINNSHKKITRFEMVTDSSGNIKLLAYTGRTSHLISEIKAKSKLRIAAESNRESTKTKASTSRLDILESTEARLAIKREKNTRPAALTSRDEKLMHRASVQRLEDYFLNKQIKRERVFSKVEAEIIGETEFKIDDKLFEQWSDLDVSDPAVMVHFSGLRRLQHALRGKAFNWNLGNLHKAIKDGINDQIVDFDDLTDEEGLQIGSGSSVIERYNEISMYAGEYFDTKHDLAVANHAISKAKRNLSNPKLTPAEKTPFQVALNEHQAKKKSSEKRLARAQKDFEKVKEEFTKLHGVIAQAKEILDALRAVYYNPLKKVEKKEISPNKLSYTKAEFNKLPAYEKVAAYLNKVFDRNHLGEKIVDSEKLYDLAISGGASRTEFSDEMWKNFLAGRSAFQNTLDTIIEASNKNEAAEKTIQVLNAYILIGNIYSEKLFGEAIDAKSITEKDFENFKITEDQIKAAQLGASVEFMLRARLEKATEDIKNPGLKKLARQYFLLNPQLNAKKRAEIAEDLNKVNIEDLGNIMLGVHTENWTQVKGLGVGYGYNLKLRHGFSLTLSGGLGYNSSKKTAGVGVGAGANYTKDLGPVKFKLSLGAGVGVGISEDGLQLGAQVGVEAGFSFYATEAYNIFGVSVFAEAGTFGVGAGAGLTLFEYDAQRHKRAQKLEFYKQIGLNEARKIISGSNTVEEKLKKLEKIKSFGPIVAEVTKAFTALQTVLKKNVPKEMKEHILKMTLSVLNEHADMYFVEKVWKVGAVNSIGFKFDFNINVAKSIFRALAGLVSFNYKKKTHVMPVFLGKRTDAIKDMSAMAEKLKRHILTEKGKTYKTKNLKNITVTAPTRLGDTGFVVMVKTPGGMIEGKAIMTKFNKVEFGKLEWKSKDESFKALKTGFKESKIHLERGSKPGSFIMNIKSEKMMNLDMTNTAILLGTDPQLQKYIDIIHISGTKYEVRFKKEVAGTKLERPENLFISRVDLVTPIPYHGADKTVHIMIKSDLTPDYILEEKGLHTSLLKRPGYRTTERGDDKEVASNNLYVSMAEYNKANRGKKIAYWQFDQSDKADVIAEKKAEIEAKNTKRATLAKQLHAEFSIEQEKATTDIKKFVEEAVKASPQFKRLTTQVAKEGILSNKQTKEAFKVLRKFAKTKGSGFEEISDIELNRAVGLMPIIYFVRITKYIKTKNIKAIKRTLKARLPLFLRLTKDTLANTQIFDAEKDDKMLNKVIGFLKKRWLAKINGITKATNFSIDREELKETPYISVLTSGLDENKKTVQGSADIDGAFLGETFKGEYTGFGLEDLNPNSNNELEKYAAIAMMQAEEPFAGHTLAKHSGYELVEDGAPTAEFFTHPIVAQVALQAAGFFNEEQVMDLIKIRQMIRRNPNIQDLPKELKPTWKAFRDMVDLVRTEQIKASSKTGYVEIPLGKKHNNAVAIIYPRKVRDFFFQKCGNISWATGARVLFVPKDIIEEEILKGPRVIGKGRREHADITSRAIARMGTIGLIGGWTNELTDDPPDKPKESPGRVEEPEDQKVPSDGGAKRPGGGTTRINPGESSKAPDTPASPNANRAPARPRTTGETGGATHSGGGVTNNPGKPPE